MTDRERKHTAVLLAVASVWQFYIVSVVFRVAPRLLNLLTGLGAELSPLLRLFFFTYRFWAAVPLIFVVLSIYMMSRRDDVSLLRSTLLIGSAFAAGFVMHAFITEIVFGTMFGLIKSVG